MEPLQSWRITSPYGWRYIFGKQEKHEGVDLVAPDRTVVAVDDGIVTQAIYNDPSGGNFLRIDHSTYQTRYLHLASLNVKKGELVTAGQPIGIYGETGNVTGPHLHFDLIVNGEHIDPLPYLRGEKYMNDLQPIKLHGVNWGLARMIGDKSVITDTHARALERLGYDVEWTPDAIMLKPNVTKMLKIIAKEIKEE